MWDECVCILFKNKVDKYVGRMRVQQERCYVAGFLVLVWLPKIIGTWGSNSVKIS